MKYPSLVNGIGMTLLLPFFLGSQNPIDSGSAELSSGNVSSGKIADCSSLKGLERVVCLAEAFKATLSDSQLATVQLPYSKASAVRWSNFPQAATRPGRVGISFGSLTTSQLVAAKALMAEVLVTGVPNEGFDELEGVRAADEYLGTTTGKTGLFSSGNFFIAFLGTPDITGLWELQYGGHHYAFANTYDNGKIIGSTPSFRGVEPMSSIVQNGKSYKPIEQERQAFASLLGSLSATERTKSLLSSTFGDVLLGPGKDGQFPSKKQGIRLGDLSMTQQKIALDAIKLYINDLDPVTATQVLARYSAELADTFLAFSGSGSMAQPNDYIRLDGPGIWLEYSGQPSRDFPGTVHPHSVWRDHTSDYGGK